MSANPIGVFDSGVGGLSVLRHLRGQLPHEQLIYLADQAHVPYGPRSETEIQQFSQAISRFFLAQSVKLVVVACNTASAAALTWLRQQFPQTPFVGMEPAVKPAAQTTRTGKVGVLATPRTFASERYADLMARFAANVSVWEDPCVGLVPQIEAGAVVSAETRALLQTYLTPMLAAGVDTVVLGCTHYPFVLPLIEQIVGSGVSIIDPAPAVARQTRRILQRQQLLAPASAGDGVRLLTTGAPAALARLAGLIGFEGAVETVVWRQGELLKEDPKGLVS